jgi:glycosyltransferase involved in cell wall biosynthesis
MATRTLRLSVILPCRNGADTVGRQLEALSKQQWAGYWEVVFVDNCSTDGTLEVARRYEGVIPNLRIVSADKKPSRAYARNLAAQHATGDAFVYCDADDEVGSGWLQAMGEALQEHEFVACSIDNRRLNESWVYQNIGAQRDGVQPMPYFEGLVHCGGGTMGVHRVLHEKIGGFDENFRWLSDTDYCLRVQLAGARLHFTPNAVVHVRYRPTYKGMFRQAFNYGSFQPAIYKRGLSLGLTKPSDVGRRALAQWKSLVRDVVHMRTENQRIQWLYRLGWLLGRVNGSFRHRVIAF